MSLGRGSRVNRTIGLAPAKPLGGKRLSDEKTVVFEDEAEARRFVMVPNALIEDFGDLSHGAFRLYVLLRYYAWQDEECFPGQVALGDKMGLSPSNVRVHTRALEACGLVESVRRGLGKTNQYIIKKFPDRLNPSSPNTGRSERPGIGALSLSDKDSLYEDALTVSSKRGGRPRKKSHSVEAGDISHRLTALYVDAHVDRWGTKPTDVGLMGNQLAHHVDAGWTEERLRLAVIACADQAYGARRLDVILKPRPPTTVGPVEPKGFAGIRAFAARQT